MTRFILFLLDRAAWLYRLAGADYAQLRAIVETKLTIDERRPSPGFRVRSGKQPKNMFVLGLIAYLVMGFFVGMIHRFVASPLVSMTLIHSFVMTLVAMALIADFSSVLLDTTDNAILQPRPVGGRTILLARLTHIVSYLGFLSLSLSAGSLIFGSTVYHPLFFLVSLATLACAVSLVVCGVSAFYLVALRFFDVERFRDVLTYFQIGMTVMIFGGYQLLPRMIKFEELRTVSIEDRWWIYLYPPAWMAGPFDLLIGKVGTPQIVLTTLAVVTPLLALWVTVRHLAPGFNRALSRLGGESGGSVTRHAVPGMNSGARSRSSPAWTAWIARRPVERAAFELVSTLCARDRQFKLRTYPSFAIQFIAAFAFLLSDREGLAHALANLHGTKNYLFALYFTCLTIPTGLISLRYSEQHEAAWIYYFLPLNRPGEILSGAMKALLLRWVTPGYLMVSIIVLVIWGIAIFPSVVLGYGVVVLFCLIMAMWIGRRLPFAQPFRTTENATQLLAIMLMLILPLLLGGVHFVLTLHPWGVPLAIPFVLAAILALMHAYRNTPWSALQT